MLRNLEIKWNKIKEPQSKQIYKFTLESCSKRKHLYLVEGASTTPLEVSSKKGTERSHRPDVVRADFPELGGGGGQGVWQGTRAEAELFQDTNVRDFVRHLGYGSQGQSVCEIKCNVSWA